MRTLRPLLTAALLMGTAALVRADVYTVSFDLSILNAGSILSGAVDTTGALLPGDTADLTLGFSDPSAYSTPTLSTVLTAGEGIGTETFTFSEMTFQDLTNGQTIHLFVDISARCTATVSGLPCDAVGTWEDDNPPEFTGAYSVVASSGSSVPEPSSVPALLILVAFALIRDRQALIA